MSLKRKQPKSRLGRKAKTVSREPTASRAVNPSDHRAGLRRLKPEKYGIATRAPDKHAAVPAANGSNAEKRLLDERDRRRLKEVLAIANLEQTGRDSIDNLFRSATGVRNSTLGGRLITDAANVPLFVDIQDKTDRIVAALGFVQELKPETAIEALLAVQMFSVHNAALLFLTRAFVDGQTVEGVESNARRVTSFMRLFLQQIRGYGETQRQDWTADRNGGTCSRSQRRPGRCRCGKHQLARHRGRGVESRT